MIFLSNRKLRLIIITLLLLIFCFFIGLLKPKANTIGSITTRLNINQSGINIDTNSIISVSEQSIVTGSLLSYPMGNGIDMLNGVALIDSNDNKVYMCNVGTSILYNDSSAQIILMSFECNVPKQNGPYSYRIGYSKGTNNVVTGITTSGYVNIVPISSTSGGSGINYINNFTDLYNQLEQIKNRDNVFYHDVYVLIENKLNAILQALQNNQTSITNIQQNTQQINDAINDSSIDSSNAVSSASSWNSKNATNGTITQLLTLPITLLNAIVSGISTSCSSFSLGILFGTNITLPCINLSNIIGSSLFTTIDILFSGFMILAISKKLIKIFNDFTNLKSNQIDELYGGGN